MRNTMQVLMAITIVCLISLQEASAQEGQYELTNLVTYGSTGVKLNNATLSPSATGPASVFGDIQVPPNWPPLLVPPNFPPYSNEPIFTVDSFLEVFTEWYSLGGPYHGEGVAYNVYTSFDVSTELMIDTELVSLNLTGPVLVAVTPEMLPGAPVEPGWGSSGSATFGMEILAMSLSGNIPGGGSRVDLEICSQLASPGYMSVNWVGAGRHQIYSSLDVSAELSIGGSAAVCGNTVARMEFNPAPNGQRYDHLSGNLTPGIDAEFEWHTYENWDPQGTPWYNQGFYTDPTDSERQKEIYWDIALEPLGQGGDTVEVSLIWSTDGSSRIGRHDEGYLERHIIFLDELNGPIEIRNLLDDNNPFVISDFNPAWVAIEVRFIDQVSPEGVFIEGEIWHESVPEPTTLSLLALGGLALIRRRKPA